jgi:hypothetical protein
MKKRATAHEGTFPDEQSKMTQDEPSARRNIFQRKSRVPRSSELSIDVVHVVHYNNQND